MYDKNLDKMTQEQLRMQMLAGIITESKYKQLLEDMEVVDRILDKISAQGKDSLTPEEKEYLNKYSLGGRKMKDPFKKHPKGFKPIKTYSEDNETQEGEIIAAYESPGEGWDKNNPDIVYVVKRNDGFYVTTYIAFGIPDEEGPFNTLQDAEKMAYDIMEELKEDW
jgi:hypothetical protein